MPKKLTQEQVIEQFRIAHGDKYDYSKVEYVNAHKKVEIICPDHGSFWQSPTNHKIGHGCPKCSILETTENSKKTICDFIKRANRVHDSQYDYSETVYNKAREKVTIICPEHGQFFQTPDSHLRGVGCPSCGRIKKGKLKQNTVDNFIEKAKKVHGDKYDYSRAVYTHQDVKVEIICPVHGSFWQTPRIHYNGCGCDKCTLENRAKKAKERGASFETDAEAVHGKKYDYSNVQYVNTRTKVEIVCPAHGSFWQTPKSHLKGHGCMGCHNDRMANSRSFTVDEFVSRSVQIHGNKYNYSKVQYKNANTKVEIVCPVHGSFMQYPAGHIIGKGCRKCSHEVLSLKLRDGKKKFEEHSFNIHGIHYSYSNVDYVNSITPVLITCPVHGDFAQLPGNHKKGHGCPKCSNAISNTENQLLDFIKSLNPASIKTNNRKIIAPYELDIYIPEHNLAIEYNGLYWHSTAMKKDRQYHLRKTQMCEEQGIRLIHIYEDEWQNKKDRVKSMISNALGISHDQKINARNCTVGYMSSSEASSFCYSNHIQGYVGAGIKLGLYHDNTLVAYMGLVDKGNGVYDLNRYCTSANVRGGFSKLLSYFKKNYQWTEIYTYAERRYSQGYLYTKNGFTLQYKTSPGYDYFRGQTRYGRQQFMKHKLHKKLEYFDPDLTEEQNMLNNGYYRIYDCGVLKFSMKNE